MDNGTIFTKTAKGVGEAAGRTRFLSRDSRKILKEVDGTASLGGLKEKLNSFPEDKLLEMLNALLQGDFIREFVSPLAENSVFGFSSGAELEEAVTMGDFLRYEQEMRIKAEIDDKLKSNSQAQSHNQAKEIADEKARREEEARNQAHEKVRQQRMIKAREFAEEQARQKAQNFARRQAEEKARQEAEARSRKMLEDQARRDAELETARQAQIQAEKDAEAARRESENLARRVADEQERQRKQQLADRKAEEKARQAALRQAKKEAEVQARREAEALARKTKEEKAQQEADARARKQAQAQARRDAELEAERQAQLRAQKDAEDRARREAEEHARKIAEQQARDRARELARLEAEERAQREAEQRASDEAEQQARKKAEESARMALEAQMKKEAEEQAQRDAEMQAIQDAAEFVRREAEEQAQQTEAERERRSAALQAQKIADEKNKAAQQKTLRKQALEEEKRAKKEARKAARIEAQAEAERHDRERKQGAIDEQKDKAAQAAEKASRSGKRYNTRSFSLAKPVAVLLFLLAVASVALVPVLSFDNRIARIEREASQQFHQPVKIGAVRLTLLPQPHWRLDGVSIGSDDQIKIPKIKVPVGLSGLFKDRITFNSVELASPSFSEEGLGWLLFRKTQNGALKIASVTATNVKFISSNLQLPVMDASAEMGADGAWKRIVLDAADKIFHIEMRPDEGAAVHIELTADSYRLPFGSAWVLDKFYAKGTANPGGLTVTEFGTAVYDGIVSGNARLSWGPTWSIKGDLNAKTIDAGKLLPALFQNSRLDGSAKYAFQAKTPDQLLAAPYFKGNFFLNNGTLLGVDFMSLLRSQNSRGKSNFAELSGAFNYENGRVQLRNMRLGAGIVSVTGSSDLDPDKNLSGNFVVDLKSPNTQMRANLVLSGTLQEPSFHR